MSAAAYKLFCKDYVQEIVQKFPDADEQLIQTFLKRRWHEIRTVERRLYNDYLSKAKAAKAAKAF